MSSLAPVRIPIRQYGQLLARYVRPLVRLVTLLALLIGGSIALQLITPQIIAGFIDHVQAGAAVNTLLRAAALYLSLALLEQGVAVATTYVSENIGWTTTNALRTDLLAHTLDLDLGFHKAHTPGEMIERVDGDVTAIASFFSQFIVQIVGNGLLIVGVTIVLARIDWRLGAVIAAFAVATLVVLVALRNVAVPYFAAERQASAALFGFLEERLGGTEDIRANGAGPYVMRRFYGLMRDQLRKSLRAGWMINLVFNASFLLFALGTAAAFAAGAYLFGRQLVTIGTVYLVYDYTKMLEGPLRTIAHELQELQRAGAGIARVNQLLATHSPIVDTPETGTSPLQPVALGVHFDHVTFGYRDGLATTADTPTPQGERAPAPESAGGAEAPETAPAGNAEPPGGPPPDEAPDAPRDIVLHDVSFDVLPGATLGLLGRTGSGKTTVTRLLLRFYDPDEGCIRLGDGPPTDIRDVPLRTLRRHVGIVTQEVQLFNASVRDNLTFFDPDIPDARIVDAITALGLGPWLASLPQGLDTVLDSGGGGLSAGESQLLAFTRIFLQDPGLVLLDEASSRLDPATERRIEQAIDRLVHNRTAIIIAHRLGTLDRADEIMILEDGSILERGPRTQLAADPASNFYRLLQTGMEEVMA